VAVAPKDDLAQVRPGHIGNELNLKHGLQPRAERVVEGLQGLQLRVEMRWVAFRHLDDVAAGDPRVPPVPQKALGIPAGAEAIGVGDKAQKDHQLVAGRGVGGAGPPPVAEAKACLPKGKFPTSYRA